MGGANEAVVFVSRQLVRRGYRRAAPLPLRVVAAAFFVVDRVRLSRGCVRPGYVDMI
jgi:hypothetical protein